MNEVTVDIAETDDEILGCFPVLSILRPHLRQSEFVSTVRRMAPEGYRLASLSVDGVVQAVAGYRIIEMLRTGRMLEIDDLVSASDARSKGYGKLLLDWCFETAKSNDCSVVELDSAVHRADAHRFYFRERMHVLAFHFSRSVK